MDRAHCIAQWDDVWHRDDCCQIIDGAQVAPVRYANRSSGEGWKELGTPMRTTEQQGNDESAFVLLNVKVEDGVRQIQASRESGLLMQR